jgi:hypothetical protein
MKFLTQSEYEKLAKESKKKFLVVSTNKKPMFNFVF